MIEEKKNVSMWVLDECHANVMCPIPTTCINSMIIPAVNY